MPPESVDWAGACWAPWSAWAATIFCALPVLFGFILPLIILAELAWESGQSILDPRYLAFAQNSLTLAGIAALLTVGGAILIAHRARSVPKKRPMRSGST